MAYLMEFEQRTNKLPISSMALASVYPADLERMGKSVGGAPGSKLQVLHPEWNSPLFSHWFQL